MNGIGVLKRAENPSKTINALDYRLYKKRKMLRWCLNAFEKIVVKHLHKSWIYTLLEDVVSGNTFVVNGLSSDRETTGMLGMTTHQLIEK
ncbi:hypothetical protein TNCV_985721 [Trichonephila clavipes]|uniref:Uncharacterized protein n=1 Tax=Trichonephila clavipes TaxID=2585209 RepID=A0A8X6SM23_TRICX|nr:hypothetical protein TNCV_985721 [Trichonephila clavipes]